VRAQKSLDLVTKSLSWFITQKNVHNFIKFVKLFMSIFVFIDIYVIYEHEYKIECVCIYIYVLFYSHCYTITIVLSIHTRGTPVTYTFPGVRNA
jgi:hypothetical protein